MHREFRMLVLLVTVGLAVSGCARALGPEVLVGASKNRAVILSEPSRDWRGTGEAHCAQYGRAAELRSVQQPDPPPQTVKTYLGSADMGPNKLYYFSCVAK
jgi:hypothetical protein